MERLTEATIGSEIDDLREVGISRTENSKLAHPASHIRVLAFWISPNGLLTLRPIRLAVIKTHDAQLATKPFGAPSCSTSSRCIPYIRAETAYFEASIVTVELLFW